MRIQNVSPLGALDVPLLRRIVEAGEQVDVSDEQAAALLPQAVNWQPADDAARAIAPAADAEPIPAPAADITPEAVPAPDETPAAPADGTEVAQ